MRPGHVIALHRAHDGRDTLLAAPGVLLSRAPLLVCFLTLGAPLLARAGSGPAAHVPVPVLADGETITAVIVELPELRPGDPVSARADAGTVKSASVIAPGLIRLEVRPPPSAAPGRMSLSLRAKGASGRLNATIDIATRGGLAAPIVLADPVALTRPGDPPVALRLRIPDTGQPAAARRLVADVSLGKVGPVIVDGVGSATVEWTPPATASGSRVGVLTLADAASPDRVFGAISLPVMAEASLTLQAPSDSQNVLTHGEQRLGPATASPAGTVAFTLAVDPRQPTAALETTTRDGRVVSTSVDLEASGGPALAFIPGPERRTSGQAGTRPVLVALLDASGAPSSIPPDLSASRGQIGAPRPTGVPGVWSAAYTPPATAGTVTLTASSGTASVERRVSITGAAPTVQLQPDVDSIAADTRTVSVLVSSDAGVPALEARGARVSARPRRTPQGTTFVVSPDEGASGIWLLGTPPRTGPSGASVAAASLYGTEGAPDRGPRPYTVRATDAGGLPVEGATVTVDAPWAEDLELEETTDPSGLARVWLSPPLRGAETLRVEVDGQSTGAVLGPRLDGPSSSPHAPAQWLPREDAVPISLSAGAAPAAAEPPPPPAAVTAPVAPDSVGPVTAETPSSGSPRILSAFPPLRVGLSGGIGGHDWSQDADDGIAGPESERSKAGPYPLGLPAGAAGVHAQGWVGGGSLGLELELLAQADDFDDAPSPSVRGVAGLMGRLPVAPAFELVGSLGAGVTPGYLVVYEDGDPDEEAGIRKSILGGELGVGVQLATDSIHLVAGLRELCTPWPVQTLGRVDLGVHVSDSLSLDLRARHAIRTMSFEVDGEAVDTVDSLSYLGVGASFLVR